MDEAIASCRVLPEPDHDEELLLAALTELGIKAAVLPWDDSSVDWTAARITVLRSHASRWDSGTNSPARLAVSTSMSQQQV